MPLFNYVSYFEDLMWVFIIPHEYRLFREPVMITV